jgi:HAD superfamily hydrolase (TIGR01549 family)
MKPENRVPTGRLCRPKALLLDFGGVIVLTRHNPDWPEKLARHVGERLAALGAAHEKLTEAFIAADIRFAAIADSHWKNAMSRPYAPRELRHEEFWGDFVAADWPKPAREAVVAEARELCRVMGHMRSVRTLRNGLIDLLDACDAAGVPVGIVSNALAGQVHLDILAEHGLTHRFATEVHSDAVEMRKPNPEMILLAARRLGVDAADCWYVGDNYDRDILCGIRAGAGGNILMEAKKTYEPPYELDIRPDAIVADPAGLLALFQRMTSEAAA